MAEELKDTKFRPCTMSCGEKVWCEEPTSCSTCRAYMKAMAERTAKKRTGRPRNPASTVTYGAAYTRGLAMTAALRTFKKAR